MGASGSRPEAVPDTPDREPREREMVLVRHMLAGDELAMEEFADGYFPGLYRFALRRLGGDSELARDMVQSTVCKALAKLDGFRGDAPLFSWLCVCCRNEIAMHFRKLGRRPRWVDFDEGSVDPVTPFPLPGGEPGEAPDRALDRKQRSRRVHAALDQLFPDHARVLEWKYVDGLSVREIARRLERSPKAAESLLGRAREAFRESYRGLVESDPTGGEIPVEKSR